MTTVRLPPETDAVCVGVIPARYASTRFPGKILAPICGKPLLAWVINRVGQARSLQRILVATDDERIAEAAKDAGADPVMTRPDHPSGTDRIAEALSGQDADIVVNVQGDEPLIDPDLIDRVAGALKGDPTADMATAVVPLSDPQEIENPSVVKAVFAADGQALYFSRSVIPHVRDDDADTDGLYWRHIGIYGYRRGFLERLVQTPPCPSELAEKLEQLRALHLGARMLVLKAESMGPGVDTPEDVAKAEEALRAAGLA